MEAGQGQGALSDSIEISEDESTWLDNLSSSVKSDTASGKDVIFDSPKSSDHGRTWLDISSSSFKSTTSTWLDISSGSFKSTTSTWLDEGSFQSTEYGSSRPDALSHPLRPASVTMSDDLCSSIPSSCGSSFSDDYFHPRHFPRECEIEEFPPSSFVWSVTPNQSPDRQSIWNLPMRLAVQLETEMEHLTILVSLSEAANAVRSDNELRVITGSQQTLAKSFVFISKNWEGGHEANDIIEELHTAITGMSHLLVLKGILAKPIQLAKLVVKMAGEVEVGHIWRGEIQELSSMAERLAELLWLAARAELYEQHTRRVVSHVKGTLGRTAALIKKCRNNLQGNITRRLFSVVSVSAKSFKTTLLELENCIGGVSSLLWSKLYFFKTVDENDDDHDYDDIYLALVPWLNSSKKDTVTFLVEGLLNYQNEMLKSLHQQQAQQPGHHNEHDPIYYLIAMSVKALRVLSKGDPGKSAIIVRSKLMLLLPSLLHKTPAAVQYNVALLLYEIARIAERDGAFRRYACRNVATIIPTYLLIPIILEMEKSIKHVRSWLLQMNNSPTFGSNMDDNGYLGPQATISCIDPVQLLIWEQVAKLINGTPEDKTAAATLLLPLARDNDEYGKLIIEAGGVSPLLKIVEDTEFQVGTREGASELLRFLTRDVENVMGFLITCDDEDQENVNNVLVPFAGPRLSVLVKLLKDGSVKVRVNSARVISQLLAHHQQCRRLFIMEGADKPLVECLRCLGTKEILGVDVDESVTHFLIAMAAKALCELAKKKRKICRYMIDSGLMNIFPVFLDNNPLQVQCNAALLLLEIARLAERDAKFRRNAFDPTSHSGSSAINQLLRIVREVEFSELLIPCIEALGCLSPVFWTTKAIGPLVRLLDKREEDVMYQAVIALIKFTTESGCCKNNHSKAIAEQGTSHLARLVYQGDAVVQEPAALLAYYVALQVPDNMQLAAVVTWATNHHVLNSCSRPCHPSRVIMEAQRIQPMRTPRVQPI